MAEARAGRPLTPRDITPKRVTEVARRLEQQAVGEKRSGRRHHVTDSAFRSFSRERNWVARAAAWDADQYEKARLRALARETAEEAASWEWRRESRRRSRELVGLIFDRCREMLAQGKPTPTDIQKLAVAAERACIVEDRAFKGLRDVTAALPVDGELSPEVAAAVEAAMAQVAARELGIATEVVQPA
jgi:hypothetical protein